MPPLLSEKQMPTLSDFYLWNASRQGWITETGTTTTNILDAKIFPAFEAEARCKAGLGHDKTPGVLPIRVMDMEALK